MKKLEKIIANRTKRFNNQVKELQESIDQGQASATDKKQYVEAKAKVEAFEEVLDLFKSLQVGKRHSVDPSTLNNG